MRTGVNRLRFASIEEASCTANPLSLSHKAL